MLCLAMKFQTLSFSPGCSTLSSYTVSKKENKELLKEYGAHVGHTVKANVISPLLYLLPAGPSIPQCMRVYVGAYVSMCTRKALSLLPEIILFFT